MAVGAVATVATFQLPELTQRLFALPAGVALIGLGYSLWRDQRTTQDAAQLGRHPARPSRRQMNTRPAAAGAVRSDGAGWWVPFVLIAFVGIPALFGSLRVIGLVSGPQLMPADPG